MTFYTSQGQLQDSLLVAQVAAEGGFPIRDKKGKDQQGLRRNDVLPKVINHVSVEHSRYSEQLLGTVHVLCGRGAGDI